MKIKRLDIQTHGNLSGLGNDPFDDRLHIVETGITARKICRLNCRQSFLM